MSRVLVTTARMWYSLNTIRILAKHGHQVYAVDSTRNSGGLYSKYVKERFLSPPLTSKPREYIDFIVDLVGSRGIEVILPTFEEVFVLSYYRHMLPEKVKILLAPYPVLAMLHDKYHMVRYAEKIGIPTPKTALLKDFDANEWEFPLVIKPRRSRAAVGVKSFTSISDLQQVYPTVNAEEYLVQEKLPAVQYCTLGLAFDGELRGNTIYKNIREFPEGGGIGTNRQTVEVAEISDYVKKIVKSLDYTGFIGADFLFDQKTGKYNLVDVNPRMNPGLFLSHTSGVDLPGMYMQLLHNPEKVFQRFAAAGNVSYTIFLEIGWFFSALFKRRFRKLLEVLRRSSKQKEDVWDWHDVKPFFVVFWKMLLSAMVGPFFGGEQEFLLSGCSFDDSLFEKPRELIELERENIAV
ncbi:MAG TPA: ATP-utilizing protein [Kosmotogaceae bacterium]|nr:ATP-utilizing protein [Kosmotogaceae bacterium]